jgi:predicted DNA-binding protein
MSKANGKKKKSDNTWVTVRMSRLERESLSEMSRNDGRTSSGQIRWLILRYLNGSDNAATA